MLKKSFFITSLLSLVILFTGCNHSENFRGWEYMPDMYRGPALETYEPYGLFTDSTSARLPVKGTVPRGFLAYQEFSPKVSGYDSAKAMLQMPEAIVQDSIALVHGREIYNLFCDHCHGPQGKGQGILVKQGKYLGVPSYADRDINLGSIFHVVTYGKNLMGAHASQITPEERWKVGLYVMKLRGQITGEEGEAEAGAETEAEDSGDSDEQTTANNNEGQSESNQS